LAAGFFLGLTTSPILNDQERGGSSRQAILKYIMANFNVGKDAKTVNVHLKLSLRAGVKNKSLKQ
jgi:histone H1/5